jgi:hypothetical protein
VGRRDSEFQDEDQTLANPDSPETHQHLDYIVSVIREGFMGNIRYSFNAPLKDLSMKPLKQGDVQRSDVVPLITTRLELVKVRWPRRSHEE